MEKYLNSVMSFWKNGNEGLGILQGELSMETLYTVRIMYENIAYSNIKRSLTLNRNQKLSEH